MESLRKILLFIVLLLSFAITANGSDLGAFVGHKGSLKIAGGTAHIPVMKEAAKMIMSANSEIRITIAGGGSGVGIKQVGEGLVNIGNAGRRATDKEIATYGLHMTKWAIDGVGVVVNPKNTVSSLSSSQLQDIYSGRIVNWKQLGGEDRQINLYDRDAASGTRSVFWKKALKKGDVTTKANVVVSNGAMKTAIGGDPWGIGYMSVGHINDSVAAVALDGVLPSLDNVKSGSYKVARGLFSNTKGEYSGLTKKFIECLFTPEGEQIIISRGFIPVN